jgi:predicted DNA-binding ribbon-helix-helix protein
VLRDLARQKGVSIATYATEIDEKRGAANLSSALRVHLLQVFRDRAAGK